MHLRSLRSASVAGKKVLVRAELNLARSASGRITDDRRLQEVVPTLRWLRRKKARIIIATKLGRPGGRVVPFLSTKVLVRPLSLALHSRVQFVAESIGPKVEKKVSAVQPGQILLLENTRFHKEDEGHGLGYAKSLAGLADLFVLECFGTAHRQDASVVGVSRYLPTFAGFRMVEEVRVLSRIVNRPRRPLVVLLGGAKISTKLGLISTLLRKADALLVGGALANTVLRAKGLQIGASLNEPAMVRQAKRLRLTDPRLHLPVDVVVTRPRSRPRVRAVGAVLRRESIFDIGPDTVTLFTDVIRTARTIVWNGPMGKYEQSPFDRGTRLLAGVVARTKAFTVIGGAETVDAFRSQQLLSHVGFVSTGGGAMIEFLEGKTLPGVAVVARRP